MAVLHTTTKLCIVYFSSMEQQKNIFIECLARKGIALCRLIDEKKEIQDTNKEDISNTWKTLVKFVDPTDAKVSIYHHQQVNAEKWQLRSSY